MLYVSYLIVIWGGSTYLFRTLFGVSILPMDLLVIAIFVIAVVNKILIDPKIIPLTHPRSGKQVKFGLRNFMSFPPSHRFDMKAQTDALRTQSLFMTTICFAFMYPILAGIFFNSSLLVQSLIIPLFFALRAWYEYRADTITAANFGSDAMVHFFFFFFFLLFSKHQP